MSSLLVCKGFLNFIKDVFRHYEVQYFFRVVMAVFFRFLVQQGQPSNVAETESCIYVPFKLFFVLCLQMFLQLMNISPNSQHIAVRWVVACQLLLYSLLNYSL